MPQPRNVVTIVVLALFASLFPPAAAAQDSESGANEPAIEEVGTDYNYGKPLPVEAPAIRRARARTSARTRIGQRKFWLAIDEVEGIVYAKRFKLRAVGEHIEVWVAADSDEISSGVQFPEGDCRNGERTRITDRQINYLIKQFDRKIYPKESRVFSRPPRRNGRNAVFPSMVGLPQNYYRGEGDRIVTLIDNVRDTNFYDINEGYIAGFFYSVFNEFFDRNVMTIDAFDWLHRTRANPPDEPVPGNICESAAARPYLYEGVFAHEYEHLLSYYEDPDEQLWVDEGLADWAQSLTGYADPRIPTTDPAFDQHVWSFLGFLGIETPANPNPYPLGGPENSLTAWGDQGDPEILSDYGAAYTLMEMLADRFGRDFMGRLHRTNASSFSGMRGALRDETSAPSPQQLVHEWLATVALDSVLDDGAALHGGDAATYRVRRLDGQINWETEEAYSAPGAPPNGGDFVRLRAPNGSPLSAGDVDSISFDGAEMFEPRPVEWTSVTNAPGRAGNSVLYSGQEANLDRTIVREVRVPTNNPTLDFDSAYELEEYWDYAFVQVSTDGGRSWTSLSNNNTTSDAELGVNEIAEENLPGFTGTSGCPLGSQTAGTCQTEPAWRTQTFDLSAYAGQDVWLSFRAVTDPNVTYRGWWIDNIALGNQNLSTGENLGGWQTASEINPRSVAGFTVQLVAYNSGHTEAWIAQLPLGAGFTGSLSGGAVTEAIGDSADTVAAIVTYDEPTGTVMEYAPYTLTVNGAQQPGG